MNNEEIIMIQQKYRAIKCFKFEFFLKLTIEQIISFQELH